MFLKLYVEEFKRIVINLKERKLDTVQTIHATASMTNLSQQIGTQTASRTQPGGGGAEDWESFRHFVRIIQIVGELIIKYEDLEVVIEKKIQEIFLHSTQKSPFGGANLLSSQLNDMQSSLISIYNFKEYLLQDSDRIKLNRLISLIESGINKSK